MLLVLWLTLSAGTLVFSTKSEPCPDTAKLTCGKTTYNPLSQICCDGVVNPLANMTHPDCCAQEAYDRSSHLCCRHNAQAEISNVSTMVQAKCCGIKAFDIRLQKCCSADVEDSMPIVYNPSTEKCKHAARVDMLNKVAKYDMRKAECGCGASYDPESQKCCPGNVVVNIPANTTNAHCCGKNVYDQHTHKCCNGLIHDIGGTVQPSCCGQSGTFYDQSTELCCDGEKKYFHGLTSPACCGKEAFDAETHTCVKGRINIKRASPPAPKITALVSLSKKEKCPDNTFVVGYKFYSMRSPPLHYCRGPPSGTVKISNCEESAGVVKGSEICPTGKLPKIMCNNKLIRSRVCGLDRLDISVTCCNFSLDDHKVTATKTCRWVDGSVYSSLVCKPNEVAMGLKVTTAFNKSSAWSAPKGSHGIYCCTFEVAAS